MLKNTLPDSASVIAKDSFAALGTNEQIQGFVYDLALGLEARELSRLANQDLIDIDIRLCHP